MPLATRLPFLQLIIFLGVALAPAPPVFAQDPSIAFWPSSGRGGPASRIGPASEITRAHEPGVVLVRLAPEADVLTELGPQAELVFGRWWRVPAEPNESSGAALWRLAQKNTVEVVELNYLMHIPQPESSPLAGGGFTLSPRLVPNDTAYDLQWNFGKVQAASAWDRSSGNGTVVAVIDSGISRAGEDLGCRTFVHEYNSYSQTTGVGAANDTNGHGTHVAGTIAQCTNNGRGVAGLAFTATLMPVKSANDSGAFPWDSVARGIDWARAHGARVINMSLGMDCPGETWPGCSAAIANDAIAAAAAADIVIVASAGNSDQNTVGFPANHPEVIAVSATGFNNVITGYSTYGSALTIAAPGGDAEVDLNGDGFPDGILQETLAGRFPLCVASNPSGLTYCFLQGTSMASPHVAGAAAMLRSHRPGATRQQIKQALAESALDLGAAGKDNLYGYGLLQISSALTRLEQITGGSTGPCIRNSETACLLGGRFEVKVQWTTSTSSGAARVMSFDGERTESNESVFFYFFNLANFEMGVKVLNACGVNNNYWIFVSGLTNQGYAVTVRDSLTGRVKTYSNPLGTYPTTVGDTSALSCN